MSRLNRQVFNFNTAITPDEVLVNVPVIEKTKVLFELPSAQKIETPFHGYVNKFDDGRIIPIKQVKSDRYQELDHRATLTRVIDELKSFNENLKIQSYTANAEHSVLRTSIILDKPFTMEQVPFELNMPQTPSYVDSNKWKDDKFYPMITVTNSFLGCSEVSFNLFRLICSNGMLFGEVLREKLSFRHFGDVTERFNEETGKFLMKIFEKRFMDNIFSVYEKKQMKKDTFVKFMEQNLGKRVGKELEENERFALKKQFSSWVAFNILTYYTTFLIKNYAKQVNAQKNFTKMIAEK